MATKPKTLIPITKIFPNPEQPRTIFDQTELEGLAQSIRENGLVQPIVVEEAGDCYILVDGERRWRAHQLAGLKKIEAVIRPATNHNGIQRLTQALVANIQQSFKGPVDEARAFERLLEELGTARAVANKVGLSEGTISTKLTLLEFPEIVQKLFNLGRLPMINTVIHAMRRLTADQQIRVATKAATRGATGSTMLRLITWESKNGNATAYAPRKYEKKEIKVVGHFDALALINGKQLPASVRAAAVQTCQACSLYPEAGPAICKECPLPDFLRRLETK